MSRALTRTLQNTTDIRDMESDQSLFYIIAIPLTFVTVGTCVMIGYSGDKLRDLASTTFRVLTGKEDQALSARGISVAQRKRVPRISIDTSSSVDQGSLADEAEFMNPQPQWGLQIAGSNELDAVVPYAIRASQSRAYGDYLEPITVRREGDSTRMRRQAYPVTLSPMADRVEEHEMYSRRQPQRKYYNDLELAYTPPVRSRRFDRVTQAGGYAVPPPVVRPESMYSEKDQVEGYMWYKKGSLGRRRAQTDRRRAYD